jgi:hypothetical protein
MNRPGYNPTRRSRNIGTAIQGYGQNNRLVIPDIYGGKQDMIEDLDEPNFVEMAIAGELRTFVVERTRDDSIHPCTVDDVATVLGMIEPHHLEDLKLIILRQPTRKQVTISPVWGRLRYFMEIGRHRGAALILEAGASKGSLQRFPRKMHVDDKAELERFRANGQTIIEDRRGISVVLDMHAQREVQLFRTVLHEVGHQVDYLEKVQRPSNDEESDWSELWEQYWQRPSPEREVFAHGFADRNGSALRLAGRIPFPRLDNEERLLGLGLRPSDFHARSGDTNAK